MAITRIGKFKVLTTLGAGANSSILHILREEDSREYALKLVTLEDEEDQKFLQQAEHEFRVAQMLSHPSLIKIYALELEKGFLGLGRVKKAKLLIEFVNGTTLDKAKLMKPAKLLRILEKVAAGLVHMHARGVLHADLKPNNIMLARGTNVKILDYGLAWIKGEPKDRIQGTPEYMAPETYEHKVVNERTDIYNFGATMYRLVTFKNPQSAISDLAGVPMTEKTFKSLFKPVPELNPGAHAGLVELIHQCMEFKATKRPESMKEIQQRLDQLADAAAAELDDPAELEE
jgi:serine/threonine protein kinase